MPHLSEDDNQCKAMQMNGHLLEPKIWMYAGFENTLIVQSINCNKLHIVNCRSYFRIHIWSFYIIMNHDSGFIIGIAMIFFAKTLIEHTPKSHLKKDPSA